MPTRRLISNLEFEGGYNTELGPTAEKITHLLRAENCFLSLDGAPYKMPGGSRYNATQITTGGVGDPVTGIFDFWRSTGATATQKFVGVAGTAIYKDDNDGTWDELKSPITNAAVPSFATHTGVCIITDDSGALAPQSYDQTTLADLGGTPPNFAFGVVHDNRFWYPNPTTPSRLQATPVGDPATHSGGDYLTFNLDTGDGDRITGLASHKGELIVFKGPNIGKIFRMTGRTAATYSLVPFLTTDGRSPGIPCVAHNSIIRFGDDLGWASPIGIHSLSATAAYGDYREAYLTAPIRSAWRDLVRSRDKFIWGVNHAGFGLCIWAVTPSGATTNTQWCIMDYRFQPPRWTIANATASASLCIRQNTSGNRRLFSGGYSGYVLECDQSNRNFENAAYTYTVHTPHVHLGEPDRLKAGKKFRLSFVPKGNYDLTVIAAHDDGSSESLAVNMAGSSALLGTFILDTDTLGAGGWKQSYADMEGDWRTTQLQLTQGGLNQDVEPHALGLMVTGSDLPEN